MEIIKDLRILKALEKKYNCLEIDLYNKYIISDISLLDYELIKKHNDFIMLLNKQKFTYMFYDGCFYPYIVKLK